MQIRTLGRLTAAVAGLTAALVTGPALAAGAGTISVPDDFAKPLSDTRATGHYQVVGTGLRVWTEGSTSTDKVAEYVATSTPLASAGEPSLELTNNTDGTIPPGFQLVTDFDGDGSADGILVGERVYGGDWWASNSSKPFVKAGAPVTGAGSGTPWHGSLDQWRAAFPQAQVQAYGFSLGSGVKGDWTIDALTFAGTRYTFATPVVLTSRDQCKNGGWATSTKPVFRNQGECVSSFASAK
ncbi:hypothetical protein SAMN04488570_1354 [Nocardioides scoriae]|uniref:FG-GAP repeat-containing protein n=1 Tax=Nocardioides scoriae TaxID=642780 RepID=A0A1H1Q9D5_9ACTN|nr:hypothetical protein [Nocardioides scoriae]SDS20138.1 hypothetical protein SAMN04488570_1354 [Nocardioides scoriae]